MTKYILSTETETGIKYLHEYEISTHVIDDNWVDYKNKADIFDDLQLAVNVKAILENEFEMKIHIDSLEKIG